MLYIRWEFIPIVSITSYFIYQPVVDVGLTIIKAGIDYAKFNFITICSDGHAAAQLVWITTHTRSTKGTVLSVPF